MASQPTNKIIVKNLPESWTFDFLLNYLEVASEQQLLVASEDIQVFPGVTHSALVTLEKPVTAETVRRSEALLAGDPFQKTQVLALQTMPSHTCSLLVHCSDPSLSEDHMSYYFEDPQVSGCGEGYVEGCQAYREHGLAVVRFSSVEALEGVVARGHHRVKRGGEGMKVERWYEAFHRPLLEQLTAPTRPPACITPQPAPTRLPACITPQPAPTRLPACITPQPAPTRLPACSTPQPAATRLPACITPQPAAVSPAAADAISRAEAQVMEELRQENERLKQMLVRREARDREEERLRWQKQHEQEKNGTEYQLYLKRQAEKHRKAMEEHREECLRIDKDNMLKVAARLQQQGSEGLRIENDNLLKDVARLQQEQQGALQHQQMEKERLKSENEKLKNQKPTRLHVPAYKFRLLGNVSEQCTGCNVTYLEHKEELVLYGMEEDCELEKLRVLKGLQDLWDDAVVVPEPVAQILDTVRGRSYVTDLVRRHPGCSVEIQRSCVQCAALSERELQGLIHSLKDSILTNTCQVPVALKRTLEFRAAKTKLEEDHMVRLTCAEDSEDVVLDGLKGDVELAARDLIQFTNLNRSGSKKFVVSGAVQGNACRNWFSGELDEVKQLILRNNGEIEAETKHGEYVLTFQCRQEVLSDVIARLEAISAERALLVNGLYDMTVRFFCLLLAEKLWGTGVESVGDISLPPKCPLPPFSLDRASDHRGNDHQSRRGQSHKRDHRPKRLHCRGGDRSSKHVRDVSDEPQSHSVSVGRTTITVKLGDITTEQVAAAVSVLGPDVNPKTTAVGAAFLCKWPSLAKALASNSGDGDGDGDGDGGRGRHRCRVLTTSTPQSGLPMSTIFHAVLSHPQKPDDVSKTVREVVMQTLRMAANQGMTSIAFPPLGVGRLFKFGEYATANAMMSTIQEFLQANPRPVTNITIVLFNDVKLAGKFTKVMKQTFSGKRPRGAHLSQEAAVDTSVTDSHSSNSSDSETSQDEDGGPPPRAMRERFEAVVCAKTEADCRAVRQMLLAELRSTFLWQETLPDPHVQALLALPHAVRQELVDSAAQRNIMLSASWNRKSVKLYGQKSSVQEMLLLIQASTQTEVRGGPSLQERDRRRKLRLPEDTHRLPRYWRVCQGNQNVTIDEAIEGWKKRGLNFNSVEREQAGAVRQLVASTWELAKVGHGADAKNLKHSNIQVKKVERLENPRLWQRYSQRREQLFRGLLDSHQGPPPARCSPVEDLPHSSGPVRTTQSIQERGPLNQDIFRQVNEHYLFHGTKTDMLSKICSEGLDDRMTGKAMLGRGVYLTESPTKADQYADHKEARSAKGQELKILMVRVLLGEPYLHNGNPEMYARPPCFVCQKRAHDCRCTEAPCYSSVVFDSSKIFREFVVYDRDVCYPEYIVTYVRV